METIDFINQELTNIQAIWLRLNDKITSLPEQAIKGIASQLQQVRQDMNLLEESVTKTAEYDLNRRLSEASTRLHARYAKTFQRLAEE